MTISERVIKSLKSHEPLKDFYFKITEKFPGYRQTEPSFKTEDCVCVEINKVDDETPWDVVLYIFNEGNNWWNLIEGMGVNSSTTRDAVMDIICKFACDLGSESMNADSTHHLYRHLESPTDDKEQICVN